jgi:predicted molibdopterin-dependent oxidoreductase YjgC
VVEMMDAAAADEIKAMCTWARNPLLSDPNAGHVCQTLEALDFLVVQDIFLTETAQLADVVLLAAWAEKDGTFTSTGRRVQWSHRAVSPPGEARDDLWIIGQVAQRLGFNFFPRQGLLTAASYVPSSPQGVSIGGSAGRPLPIREGVSKKE